MILITGACGHIGREVCRVLKDARRSILPIDVEQDETAGVLACDLRSEGDIARLFQSCPIHTVIHLAGILPSAFQMDPLMGADVNLRGSCELMRQSAGRAKRVRVQAELLIPGMQHAEETNFRAKVSGILRDVET